MSSSDLECSNPCIRLLVPWHHQILCETVLRAFSIPRHLRICVELGRNALIVTEACDIGHGFSQNTGVSGRRKAGSPAQD